MYLRGFEEREILNPRGHFALSASLGLHFHCMPLRTQLEPCTCEKEMRLNFPSIFLFCFFLVLLFRGVESCSMDEGDRWTREK